VADTLLAQGKLVITADQKFRLSAATQDEQDARWQRRTVLVTGVPEDMEETVVMYLENRRKGGGDIETTRTDKRGTLMVTFYDENGTSLL